MEAINLLNKNLWVILDEYIISKKYVIDFTTCKKILKHVLSTNLACEVYFNKRFQK